MQANTAFDMVLIKSVELDAPRMSISKFHQRSG